MRRQFNSWFQIFYSPSDLTGGNIPPADNGGKTLETLELLNQEDEPEETLELDPKAPKEFKSEESDDDAEDAEEPEEIDELKEIEEELEGPKEEDLELTTPVRRKEILAKYPKLFKDFPYLEKAYYREQQFTELLPTIDDAKVAVRKAQILDQVDSELKQGDIRSVLKAARDEDQESFLKIADNYLPALRAVDQNAYYHVLGNVIKDTIITMVKESRALGEQGAPLQAAANILNQFIFGSQQFTPPRPLAKTSNPEDQSRQEQIQNEDRQRFMQQFESTRDSLQMKADNVLKSTINEYIDPNKSMTDFVRKNATREAFENLESLLSKDTRFRGLLDRLWEKAFEKNFDAESTNRIRSAYLSKAKTLLPSVIKKARQEALRGMGRRSDEDRNEERPLTHESPARNGNSAAPRTSGRIKNAKDIPRGMSTLDFLNKD